MSQRQDLRADDAPTVEELHDPGHWTSLARQHWANSVDLRRVKMEVIKNEIWDRLESENFEFRSLVTLENLQLLEKSGIFTRNFCDRH